MACTYNIALILVPVLVMASGILLAGKKEVKNKLKAGLYMFAMVFPYAWIGICSMLRVLPMHTIICFLSISVSLGCAVTMRKSIGNDAKLLQDLRARTLLAFVIFTVLLAASLLAAKFI